MLEMPEYIRKAGVVGLPITHAWNDDEPRRLYREDERIGAQIAQTTYRGVLALSAATAEWVAWRLHGLADTLPLLNAIEATWAGVSDVRYDRALPDRPCAPAWEDFLGPTGGPVCGTFLLLASLRKLLARNKAMSPDASSLVRLAALVQPDEKPFRDWFKASLDRLVQLHPRVDTDRLGTPVPREAFDPAFPYKPDAGDDLVKRFLHGLDPTKNPFLATPEEMAAEGFEGKPYL